MEYYWPYESRGVSFTVKAIAKENTWVGLGFAKAFEGTVRSKGY